MRSDKPRIIDIARKIGVSTATVSNVLNKGKGASSELIQRIRDAADEMGYESPGPGDRKQYIRLVIAKKHGLVVMDTQFFTELIGGIEQECRRNHIDLMMTNLPAWESEEYRARVHEICNETCAGIILLATELPVSDLICFADARSPLVYLDNALPHFMGNAVFIDNFEAGYLAANYLISKGHKEIGHIGSKPDFNNMIERRLGLIERMREEQIAHHQSFFIELQPTIEGAYADMDRLLSDESFKLPTAYFAANDILAVGAMRAMIKHGIRIPENVSIIGMDDLSIGTIVIPELTTLRVPRISMGEAAVRRILSMRNKEEAYVLKTSVSVSLVERESVSYLCV